MSAAAPARAQSLLERSPNVAGTWVAPARTAHFTFLHRFELVGEESKKVVNYPTFALSIGLPGSFGLGITYASRSELGAGTANEWELGARRRFRLGSRAEAAAYAAWNTATESIDGEVALRGALSRVTIIGAARWLSDAYDEDASAAALAGGALIHLTPRLALAADVARVVTTDTLPTAWSAGLHLAIPGSPHTLGFVVSNVGTATLQGASRGAEDEEGDANLRYGFAFTMPLGTFAQWGRIFSGEGDPGPEAAPEMSAETNPPAKVVIRDFTFAPAEIHVRAGDTVRWTNRDPTQHSVTAKDGTFDSGLIEPGATFTHRFDAPGRYEVACRPHPFMTALIVVEPGS